MILFSAAKTNLSLRVTFRASILLPNDNFFGRHHFRFYRTSAMAVKRSIARLVFGIVLLCLVFLRGLVYLLLDAG